MGGHDGFGSPHSFAKSCRLASNPIIVPFCLALPWPSLKFLGVGLVYLAPSRQDTATSFIRPNPLSIERATGRSACHPSKKGEKRKKRKKFAPYPIIICVQDFGAFSRC